MSRSNARRVVSKLAPGYARAGELEDPLRGIEAALLRYRVMAYLVGVGLASLVFIGVPLQFAAGIPQLDSIVGPIHGFLYIVYLIMALDLARRARFTFLQMIAMVGAGFIPLLAFVIEHRVATRLRRELESIRPFLESAQESTGAASNVDPDGPPSPALG